MPIAHGGAYRGGVTSSRPAPGHHAHHHAHYAHHHLDRPPGAPAPDEAELAEVLDLDAEVFAATLEELTAWAAAHAPADVRTVVDLGAGTGTGTLALARRFPAARVLAVDASPAMLTRLRAAACAQGLDPRVEPVPADLDDGWPEVGGADLVWASSSLHHVADPDRVLRDVRDALRPGGALVVVEIAELPRFLPDGAGRELEERCAAELARAGWNPVPDWGPHLERAGLELVERRTLPAEVRPDPASDPDGAARTARFARLWLGRVRTALDGRLAPDDLAALDRLLADEGPGALARRDDLAVRGSRTAWAARRP